jgi:hypothetical protein
MYQIVGESIDANFLAMLSDVLRESDLIKIPEGATYELQDVINVLLYASSSCTDSIESTVSELKRKNPDVRIPSADTIHNYLKKGNINDIVSSFGKINREFLRIMGIPDSPQDMAMDIHDIGFYGDRDTLGIRGIKPKNGTSWGYSFLTIDLIGENKMTIDIVNITGLNKNYASLLEGTIRRVESMGVTLGTLFLDREFFNLPAISTLHLLGTQYIMAAKSNKRINRLLNEHVKKCGRVPLITTYQFKDPYSPEFYLIAIPNPDYDPLRKGSRNFYLFATNIEFASAEEFIKRVPEEYRKRWNIETGYRVKNDFKIRTCSRSYVVRTLFFVLRSILHNYLNLLKRGLRITAYTLKSIIVEDVLDVIRGHVFWYFPLKEFYDKIERYNMERDRELRYHLAIA